MKPEPLKNEDYSNPSHYDELVSLQNTHETLLVALEYKRKECKTLRELADNLARGIEELLNHGTTTADFMTGEQIQYQANPQIALDYLTDYRKFLKATLNSEEEKRDLPF